MLAQGVEGVSSGGEGVTARSGGVGVAADCLPFSSSENTVAGDKGENELSPPEEVEGREPLIGVPFSSFSPFEVENSRGSMTSSSRGVSGIETKKTALVRDPETL